MSELRGSPAQSDAANTSKESGECTEMQFLNMILTKDSSLCSMQFTVSSTGGFYRKLYYTPDLKLRTEKSAKKNNSSLFK
jgi:hypothetical protein